MSDLTAAEAQLAHVANAAKSDEYPCPICQYHRAPNPGMIRLTWDHEVDDMGYKVSSWPIFEGSCEDPEREPFTVRGMKRYEVVERNHADQLNHMCDDDGHAQEEISLLLGAAQERRRLRLLLGIEQDRW